MLYFAVCPRVVKCCDASQNILFKSAKCRQKVLYLQRITKNDIMATTKFRLSAKTDRATEKHEILITFYHGKIYQRAKTGVFVRPEHWNESNDNPVAIPRFRLMNAEQKQLIADLTQTAETLKELERHVQQSFIDAGAGKNPVAADWLKTTVRAFFDTAEQTEQQEETQQAFFDAFDYYVERKKFSLQRRRHYDVLRRILQRYELFYKVELTFDAITPDTLRDFEKYLSIEHELFAAGKLAKVLKQVPESRNPQPRGNNAIHDLMKRLRAFIRWANGLDKDFRLEKPLTRNNPFDIYTLPKEIYGTPYYITIDERKKLYNAKLPEPLATQRDIFVFQCLIGCRVSDLWNMTSENVIDGAVQYIPRKTKDGRAETVSVPLSKTAVEILERYKDDTRKSLFPFTSQQQYNIDIKLFFKAAGLDRVVTILNPTTREEEKRPLYDVASSHMARRTFVGNLYKQVKDPNLISSLSGHAEGSRAFSRYRAIDDDTKKQTIDLLE